MHVPRIHPIILIASIALMLFSALGIAALLGVLPSAGSRMSKNGPLSQALTPPVRAQGAASALPATRETRADTAQPAVPPAAARVVCTRCGRVEAVRAIEVKGEASGVGAVAGGVAGALLGNQFGRGEGRTVMTVAGGAGGAIAGHEIEKHVKKKTVYRVNVRMDDGSLNTHESSAAFTVGDRVRVRSGALERV